MATTITIPTPTIHWLLYPLCILGIAGALWLWNDTKIKDAATLQAVSTAKTAQVQTDKQAETTAKTAADNLKNENVAVEKRAAAAKTPQQQIALINQEVGTHIQTSQPTSGQPQALVPSSSQVTLPVSDLPILVKQQVDFQEANNQIAVDKLNLAAKDEQIEARDQTIDVQSKEIVQLKGGSHLKRFFKATRHVLIGAGVGVVIGYAIHNK